MEIQLNEAFTSREKQGMEWNFSRIGIAASIMILVATSLFYGIQNYRISRLKETVNQISVPLGSRSMVVLPDGSQVWLNSGSKLFYPSGFWDKSRKVTLEGEGFFDVKNDLNSPFIVSAGGLKIKVLGTSFNVKSYPDEKTVETILVKGIVEVNTLNETGLLSPIILAPNQKLTYTKSEGSMNLVTIEKGIKQEKSKDLKVEIPDIFNFKIATRINPEIFTSWKDGKLIIDGETLESLIPKLERFYNVRISLQDESLKTLKYSGVLEEITIEEVLRAIQSTSPIRFEINKNQVVLKMSKK
jgi:ferric-dicitrate binding protein FerR (iron transport regulator)